MSVLRYPFMFDNSRASASGITPATASGVFSTHRYEYEQSQALRQSNVQLTGASYDYDQLEGAPALKANGVERVRYLTVGDADDMNAGIDAAKAMQSYGRGRLWSQTAPGSGLRWAWARLTDMPQLSFTVENISHAPVILNFERFSDWYDAEPIGAGGEFSPSTDPQTISVTNPGASTVRNAIITIGPTTGGIVKITNTTTGHVLEFTISVAGAERLRIDCGRNTVEYSSDDGATYTDGAQYFVRAAGQVALMEFAPGANSLLCEGCDGGTVTIEFYGSYD